MTNNPQGGHTRFQIICTPTAAAALSRQECEDLAQEIVPLAWQRDSGVHEGLVFATDVRGVEWEVVVDLVEGWIKFFAPEELDRAMKEAVQKN
jgi:hypothetical protein